MGWQFQEVGINAIDESVRLIKGAEGVDILIGDVANWPGWLEIKQVGLVNPFCSCLAFDQATFFLEAMPKSCVWKGLKHAHHGVGNASAGHELDDSAARALFLAVESDDETSHHPQSVGGDFVDRIH